MAVILMIYTDFAKAPMKAMRAAACKSVVD